MHAGYGWSVKKYLCLVSHNRLKTLPNDRLRPDLHGDVDIQHVVPSLAREETRIELFKGPFV